VGDDVRDLFLDRPARDRWELGRDLLLEDDAPADGGRELTVVTPFGEHEDLLLPLHGAHQAANAALAIGAAEAFFGRALERDDVGSALASVVLPGRVEVVRTEPTVVLDAAHNPDGMAALARTLRDLGRFDRRIVVLGALADREPEALLAALELGSSDLVFACAPDSPRAQPAGAIAAAARGLDLAVREVADPVEAADQAVDEAQPGDLVVVTGSIYVVGAVRAAGYRGSISEESGTNHGE
jgi:dihydrofolate synthase/folylpolyglutamate synthase